MNLNLMCIMNLWYFWFKLYLCVFHFYFKYLFFGFVTESNSQCNGYESLCSKKYNEVAYLNPQCL